MFSLGRVVSAAGSRLAGGHAPPSTLLLRGFAAPPCSPFAKLPPGPLALGVPGVIVVSAHQTGSSAATACSATGNSASAAMSAAPSSAVMIDRRIGFLGSGQMAEALARGFIKRGLVAPERIACSDPNRARLDLFKSFGAVPYDTNMDVVRNADVLFVAVKPQHVAQVLQDARPLLGDAHVIVSIAAGITVDKLVDAAGPDAHVIRVMPNTPCLVGETAAAMCLGGKASADDEALVRSLFEAVGKIYTVDEKLLAAVTGLSGSGPAYVYMMIEALADGGVRAGLPRDIAQALAAQTVMGSAKMVLETGSHPGALKDMVCSPAGTTIAGVHELEKAGLRAALMNAVVAATDRANQLSKM